MTLKDEKAGVIFYFESDGQHVTALDKDGKVLWHRNPVEEAMLKGFAKDGKTVRPIILFAGPPLDWMLKVMRNRGKKGEYIAISISTKAFGLLDKQTGEFTHMGSD
jgi:hypothetical protein